MSNILDLGMSDEEYLNLLAEGRDPVQEHFYTQNLIRAGVSPEEAMQVAYLSKKVERSPEEEAFITRIFRKVRSQ
jgi:hypothetical protein